MAASVGNGKRQSTRIPFQTCLDLISNPSKSKLVSLSFITTSKTLDKDILSSSKPSIFIRIITQPQITCYTPKTISAMATLRLHALTGAREEIPTPSFVSNPRMSSPSFHCNKKRVSRRMTVNAMGGGGAKYKGTLMREKQLTEMIEKKVTEAKQVCEGDETSDECKVAWDEVEEVSQAKADLRLRLEVEKKDPLESFCQENPETEECKVYED